MDELLWLILAHARSLNTTRLKSGVLKTIPTQLGKDAVLEAEIEIRAYRDKTQSKAQNARPAEDVLSAFPLQQAFDVSVYFHDDERRFHRRRKLPPRTHL